MGEAITEQQKTESVQLLCYTSEIKIKAASDNDSHFVSRLVKEVYFCVLLILITSQVIKTNNTQNRKMGLQERN